MSSQPSQAAGARRGPRRGECHPEAKLTARDVEAMRRLYAAGGLTYSDVGRMFGLSRAAANKIVSGESWKDAPGPTSARRGRPRGESNQQAKLTDARVEAMRRLYAAGGVTFAELARRFGVSACAVRLAVGGVTWKHAPGPTSAGRPPGKLNPGQVATIRRAFARGTSAASLGRRFGVSETVVYFAVRGNTYRKAGGPAWTRRGTALNAAAAAEIRRESAAGASGPALARRFGVSRSAVRNVLLGVTWKEPPTSHPVLDLSRGRAAPPLVRGEPLPSRLSNREFDILEAMVNAGCTEAVRLDEERLTVLSKRTHPVRTLRALVTKFPALETVIDFPGRKGLGGYGLKTGGFA